MRRIQAFEIHDHPWCPEPLRESVVEALGHALRFGRVYEAVAPLLAELLDELGGADSVLDLASGTGEPAAGLVRGLEARGRRPPRFLLSDLHPNLASLRAVAARHPAAIAVHPEPLDATRVPEALDAPVRTVIGAFHHFPPAVAAAMMADAVGRSRAVMIVEPMTGDPLASWGTGLLLAGATLALPLTARRHRLAKAVGLFAPPVVPGAIAFDSLISLLRVYREGALRAMVAELDPGYAWRFERLRARPGIHLSCFLGWPRA